jgi:hypothetical protein
MRKRLISLLMTLCMVLTLLPSVFAADIRSVEDFYLKQQTSSTCTLASAAMMMRRRAYLDGLDNWSAITESSLRRVAWSYVGLSHDFSMSNITVLHGAFESGTSVETQLIAMLKSHPEGIVVYNRHVPHAILVTDYTDGTFYCADPSSAAPSGRIPVSACTISISNANFYWYVASDFNTISGINGSLCAQAASYPVKLKAGSDFVPTGTLSSPGTITKVDLYILNDSESVVQHAEVQPGVSSYDLANLAGQIPFSSLTTGSYTYYLTADDDAGGHIRLKKSMTVSAAETVTSSYSGSVPTLSNINAINLTENGFSVEADASDPDSSISAVLFSAWADGNQFKQGMIGSRSGSTFSVPIEANAAQLGIDSFMINVTAIDSDGNYAKAALLVKVKAEDETDPDSQPDLTADQLLL